MSKKNGKKPKVPAMDLTDQDIQQLDLSHQNGKEKKNDSKKESPQKKAIEVRSASLKDIFCNYSYDHTISPNITNRMKCEKSEVPVHTDLVSAFKKLNPHLATICEEVDWTTISDIDSIEDYDDQQHEGNSLEHKISAYGVSAFRLEGENEKEGVVLIGTRILSTGELLKLETPKKLWESDYAFINELRLAIYDVISEVEQYMGGKRAPDQQQSLFEEPEFAEESL